jgi:phenylalanyl-tRNA synthetase beta chain
MKISLNHIRYYRDKYQWSGDAAPNGVEELERVIGAQLAAIEEVVPMGKRYEDIIIAQIVSCIDHPNADRLHVCTIDDGGVVDGVERDQNGYVQVVCGAPNVREGLLVAWLPPGATVPATYDKDPFVLEARELRGQMSNGMLASAHELGISDDHNGILEIDEDVQPGRAFAEVYGLKDDVIIDMENKMFTHRPDCFGMLGIAREIAGIQHQVFKSPEWYRTDPEFPAIDAEELKLEVSNELPEIVPRFSAITMSNVKVAPSPVWLQICLSRLGLRPINNIVDLTNYFMVLTGQPLHAYDYDKVKALSGGEHARIVVRHPRRGEKLNLLNGKEVEPRAEAIMITTGDHLIGIGGVMGGAETEVDETTRNIIFEAASFDMYSIRRTSMAHGLFTDAVTRFNKGQSPLQTVTVLARIVADAQWLAEAKVASEVIDINSVPAEVMERGSLYAPVTVTAQFVNERLGFKLSAEEMKTLLTNVEFKVDVSGDSLTVTAPFWRTDIEIPEDVVEEIGRLYGYDHLPMELPLRNLTPALRNTKLDLRVKIRKTLVQAGANEVLTYSFVHGNLLDKVGQDKDQAYRLSNALSPDLQYYRLSLMPSLLDKVHPNIKAGYGQFALFELGKAHIVGHEEDGLPKEFERLALVFAADDKVAASRYAGAPYYQAHKYLTYLLNVLGLGDDVKFEELPKDETDAATAYYAPGRAATVKVNDIIIGRIGEFTNAVRADLKLPAFSAGFELGLEPLYALAYSCHYMPLSRFPKVEQDICLKVPTDVTYQQVYDLVLQKLNAIRSHTTTLTLSPVDIYQREDDKTNKQVTLRVSMADHEKTMTDAEVSNLLDQVAITAHDELGAARV